jgi:esterase/lipase superfamily enzyme
MNREYHKWFSPTLGRDMELLVFGHAGTPTLVFPSSQGRFYEYEDRSMIAAAAHSYESGQRMAFCVDSVDAESFYNKGVPPRWRIARHTQYEQYLLDEVLPFMRNRTGHHRIVTTGCSFGGYHAVNFALRHPDIVHAAISMSGAFDISQFLHGYYDQDVYFHNPVDYLANLADDWYLSRYRDGFRLVLSAGQQDICYEPNIRLHHILNSKAVPHWLDIWGGDSRHDWPLWFRMAQKFL